MSAAHTPGPWFLAPHSDNRNRGYIRPDAFNANGLRPAICRVNHMGRGFTETTANARLIAAAPDLLDACEKALWQLIPDAQAEEAEGRQDSAVKTSDILRAALAKAGVR